MLVYIVLWVGGVASHVLFGGVRADQGWLAALFLLLAGLIVFISARGRRELATIACIALCGFLVEATGVRFGVPFGRYVYTDTLGLKLLGVPLVMASAWVTLVAYVREMMARLQLPAWFEAIFAALWLTAIDLIIDPLAAHRLDYWRWQGAGIYYNIPATNFAGWFLTGLLVFSVFRRPLASHAPARLVGVSIVFFFTLLALAHQLYLAALIGSVLCALHCYVDFFAGPRRSIA